MWLKQVDFDNLVANRTSCCSESGTRGACLTEVKQGASRLKVLWIRLRVECDVVASNRAGAILVIREAERVEDSVHVRHIVLDSLIHLIINLSRGPFTDDTIDLIPSEVRLNEMKQMKVDRSLKCNLGARVRAVSQILKGTLKHVSLTKGGGERLDFIRNLVHPDVEEWLSFVHYLLLHKLAERLDLSNLLVENQVLESLKIIYA